MLKSVFPWLGLLRSHLVGLMGLAGTVDFPWVRSSQAQAFSLLYNQAWHQLPLLPELQALALKDWDFSFWVESRSPAPQHSQHRRLRSTLLREVLTHKHWAISTWLLIDQRLIIRLTRHLKRSDLLYNLRFLDFSATSFVLTGNRFTTCASFKHLHGLDGLVHLPFADLLAVVNYFWTHASLPIMTKALFVLVVSFQRYLIFADLEEARQLLNLGSTQVDYHQLQHLLFTDRAKHHRALNPAESFAPLHEILERLRFGQTLRQELPVNFPVKNQSISRL